MKFKTNKERVTTATYVSPTKVPNVVSKHYHDY